MRVARSLRGRVALAALSAAALVVVIAGAALIATAGKDERRDLDQQLERRAHGFGGPGPPGGRPQLRPDRGEQPAGPGLGPPPDERFSSGSDELVRLFRDGSLSLQFGEGPTSGELPLPDGDGFETVSAGGQNWRTFTESRPAHLGTT